MAPDDPIVAKVRAIRDEYARSLGYDLDRIFADIRKREARSGRTYVQFPHRLISPVEKGHDESDQHVGRED